MPVEERQLLLGVEDMAVAAGERDRRKLIESGQPPGSPCRLQISLRRAQVLVVRKRIVDQAVEQGVRKPGPVSLDGIPVLETRLGGVGKMRIDGSLRSMIVGAHCAAREHPRARYAAPATRPPTSSPPPP